LSVAIKGTLDKRLFYYKTMGIQYTFDKDETVYSDAWGMVRAYSRDEIERLCQRRRIQDKRYFCN